MGVKLIITSSGVRIAKFLGHGDSHISIITSAALALSSFFYIYTVGSYFKVDIYFLQNRVTYFTFFHNYVFSKFIDYIFIASVTLLWLVLSVGVRDKKSYVIASTYGGLTILSVLLQLGVLLDIIALLSIPLVVSLLVYNRFFAATRVLKARSRVLYVNYLVIIGIAMGIFSIIITLTPVLSLPQPSISIPNYAHALFALFSSSSPILIFLLVFCLPVKLLLEEFVTRVLKMKDSINSSLSSESVRTRSKILFLSLFILLSVTIAVIPHEPLINKTNQYVGTDSSVYVDEVKRLAQSNNPQEFIQETFRLIQGGDRPLTLISLFTMVKIVPADPSYTIDRMPIILGPALVLVFYFLTRELTSNDTASLLAAFLTAISFQTLSGIYAGFYSNLLALIIAYLSVVFLIKFLKAPRRVNFAIYSALVLLLLFTHVYTWTIFTIVTAIFVLVLFKLNYYRRHSIILVLSVVLSSVVIDVARTTITGASGGVEGDLAVSKIYGIGLDLFSQRWSNLVYATQVLLGGQLSNPIILMLGLYWLLRCRLLEVSSIFVVIFLSVGILPLFVGSVTIQGRVFYDIPFQIPAAIALTYLRKQYNGTRLLFPIGIWLIAMSINAASNFYFVEP